MIHLAFSSGWFYFLEKPADTAPIMLKVSTMEMS